MYYEDIYLEGYYDALEYINESKSSVQNYLNHHSIGGTLFGPPLFRWFNSELKKGDSFMGVGKLYPKYHNYCLKRGYSPLSKGEFIKEGKKYYELKAKVDIGQFGAGLAGDLISTPAAIAGNTALAAGTATAAGIGAAYGAIGIGGAIQTAGKIGSTLYRRSDKFTKKAGMRNDLDY